MERYRLQVDLSEDVWFGIGTIGSLLFVEQSSLETASGGAGVIYTVVHGIYSMSEAMVLT